MGRGNVSRLVKCGIGLVLHCSHYGQHSQVGAGKQSDRLREVVMLCRDLGGRLNNGTSFGSRASKRTSQRGL